MNENESIPVDDNKIDIDVDELETAKIRVDKALDGINEYSEVKGIGGVLDKAAELANTQNEFLIASIRKNMEKEGLSEAQIKRILNTNDTSTGSNETESSESDTMKIAA